MESWQQSVPDGMTTNLDQLEVKEQTAVLLIISINYQLLLHTLSVDCFHTMVIKHPSPISTPHL